MDKKTRAMMSLQAMGPLEGVLPTGAAPLGPGARAEWSGIGDEIARADIAQARDHSRSALRSALPHGAFEDSAVEMLSGSDQLRQQLAGFAGAGIGLFHASRDYLRMSLDQRATGGGSEAVTRVMIDGTRILLEPRRIVVQIDPLLDRGGLAEILDRYGLFDLGGAGMPPGLTRLACPDHLATEAALALMAEDAVTFAEPDFIEHIGARHIPGDPDYARQWHHARIGAEAAWDITTGEGVHVAVIDNGFDTAHQDLNLGPLSGWFRPTADYADTDFVPGTDGMPDRDHGTACAGMIAARQGNCFGGCGVAYGSDLSALACIADQVGTQSTLARAVAYAVRPSLEGAAGHGADIVCCSLGPNGAVWRIRQVLADALGFAATQGRDGRGTAVFWASTNGNYPISADEVCSHADVIAVGRSTMEDLDDSSGFGTELEFLVPGVSVWLPTGRNGHASISGTSFAAPAAAAVGALALSCNPDLSATALRETLRESCEKIGPLPYSQGRNPRYGHGRLNALNAVQGARAAFAIAGNDHGAGHENA